MSHLTSTFAAAVDPWTPFDKGGGKGRVVPESSFYGAVLIGFCLFLIIIARLDRPKR